MRPNGPWLGVEEVADILETHPEVVRRWLRDGRLRGFKIGRAWHVPVDALPSSPSANMPMNVLQGRVRRVDRVAGMAWVSTGGEDLVMAVPGVRRGSRVRILLGADAILVSRARLRAVSARNQWRGRVQALVHRGAGVEVHVETRPPLVAWMTPGAVQELDLRPGVSVVLVFKAGSCRVTAEREARRSKR